jgi:hypothetical protein
VDDTGLLTRTRNIFEEPTMKSDLRLEIERAINRTTAEAGSNTPDYILAEFLVSCLSAFDTAVNARERATGGRAREAFLALSAVAPTTAEVEGVLDDYADLHPMRAKPDAAILQSTIDDVRRLSHRRAVLRQLLAEGNITREQARAEFPESF